MRFVGAALSLILAVIEFLLVFRFMFRLLGANPTSPFVAWVYDMAAPLITPFVGIFGEPAAIEGAVTPGAFELATLIAIAVYGLLGGALVRLFVTPRSNIA